MDKEGTAPLPGIGFECVPDEGEPVFKLLARDPIAADLVRLWAAVRSGLPAAAAREFTSLMVSCDIRYRDEPTSSEQLASALSVAEQMDNYKEKK